MKLQRTTWILLAIALGLGGAVALYELQIKPQTEKVQAQKQQIFNFTAEDIARITLETEGQTLQFDRTDDEEQSWQMKQPEASPASDAAVSYLVNLLVSEKSDRSFSIPAKQSADYGFDNPFAKITIQLNDQKTHQLILGKLDLGQKFYYAQTDLPTAGESTSPAIQKEQEIMLISQSFQLAIQRELTEWKDAAEPKTTPETDSESPALEAPP